MLKIITLSGDIGGGKSSVAKNLAQILGYTIIGTGTIQREIAKKRGLTTLELNQLSITDRSIDAEIDGFVVELGKTGSEIIIDSRLAWHFIPQAFKAFLTVDPLIGAQRVFGDQRAEEQNPTLEKTLENNLHRQRLETDRFKNLYQINLRDFANYDTVIDTSHTPPAAIAAKLAELYQAAQRGETYPRLWLNPQRLGINSAINTDGKTHPATGKTQGVDNQAVIAVGYQNNQFQIREGQSHAAQWAGRDLIPCRLS